MINSKTEEIASLSKIVNQSSEHNEGLVEKIKDMETAIREVEEKNKRLGELLNANIYNRAE